MLVLAGAPGHHHRAFAHTGQFQELILDLADFNPEAADLDLRVTPPQKLELPVRQAAAIIAAPVHALTRAKRILQERALRAFGVVNVPAAHTHPGENDLTGRAKGHRLQLLVHDVDEDIVDGAAQRNAFSLRRAVHDLVVGVVRGLGEAIGVHQLDEGLDREPALDQLLLEGLARGHDVFEILELAWVLAQIRHEDFEVGRHDLYDIDPCGDDLVNEALRVEDHLLFDDQGAPTDQKRGNQLPQRNVEALRRRLGHHSSFADLQIVNFGEEVVEQSGVLAHRALRLTGGTGGEVDVRELVGSDVDPEIAVGMALLVCRGDEERLDSGERVERRIEHGGAAALGEYEPAARPGKRPGDALGREMRLDGQISPARPADREHGGHPVQNSLRHPTGPTLAAKTPGQPRAG